MIASNYRVIYSGAGRNRTASETSVPYSGEIDERKSAVIDAVLARLKSTVGAKPVDS